MAGGWVFYTVLPEIPRIKPSFNRIARFGPLIGIILGLIQSSIWLTIEKSGWPKECLPLFIISTGIWLTGGLHLDGLVDTADGIAAGKEKRLAAMKDSRVGSIGLLALISLLLIQLASLFKLGNNIHLALTISLFWGRFSSIWAISFFPYLQKKNNSGFHQKYWRGFIEESKISLSMLIVILSIISFSRWPISMNIPLMVVSFLGIIPSIIIPHCLGNFLNGHSGDSYGACVVLVETFMLFLFSCIVI